MWQYMQHPTRLLHVIPYQSQESIITSQTVDPISSLLFWYCNLHIRRLFILKTFFLAKKLPTKINITKTKSMTFKVHNKFNQKNCFELHIPLISHFIVKNHILYINNKIYEKKPQKIFPLTISKLFLNCKKKNK